MYFYDIVYTLAAKNQISIENLSLKLGKTASYIPAQKSRRSSPKVDTASTLVSACGYTLCAVPKDEIPESAFVISIKDEESK